ncbi:MAG: N-acetyl-gamma-glutamyl-phosphate reductase [Terrimicrobiaceae bacterium]
MKPKIFIDGAEGTTGLEIRERLLLRDDLVVVEIDPALRKDPTERSKLLNASDVAILCLPDAAARESVSLVTNPNTKILDASTAHRTAPGWTYGLPEIGLREAIRSASRVAVCGCHATGFILAAHPLVQSGLLQPDTTLVATSLTGYSGGGKPLIAAYESGDAAGRLPVAPYALGLRHKHLPEMQWHSGLRNPPLFQPVVGNFSRGMLVSLFLLTSQLTTPCTPHDIRRLLSETYTGESFIRVMPDGEGLSEGFLDPLSCNNTNRVDLFVFGHDSQLSIVARLDNLGKGASGCAIQNLNIMLGFPEDRGLKK